MNTFDGTKDRSSHPGEGNPSFYPGFELPNTIDEAEGKLVVLQAELAGVETQLGIRGKQPGTENQAWRASASRARNAKADQIRQLKLWIKRRMRMIVGRQLDIDPNDDQSLLAAAYGIISRMQGNGAKVPPSDLPILELISSRM